MGPLGVQEMIFIFVLALVVFGPKQLPELGKKLGKGMAEFKRASAELKGTFQREMDNIERETKMEELKIAASDVKKQVDTAYYDDGEDDYYDAYGDDVPASSTSTKSEDSSPSTGESTDTASSAVETPSSDSSNSDQPISVASDSSSEGSSSEKQAESSAA